MNEKQLEHYKNTFEKRYEHRMAFADFIVDYLDTIFITKFSLSRVYAAYDTFQERLYQSELPDEEVITINDKKQKVVEIVKRGEIVLIKFKAGKKWGEIRCPLELIKFTDWWIYT